MKMNLITSIFLVFLSSTCVLATGCATCPTVVSDMLGISHGDLEKARATGIKKEVALNQTDVYYEVLEILKKNKITTYQKSLAKGYIIALNFPKQTNTTRVGIFFEPSGTNKTTITLSSLSSTALERANVIIFGELDKKILSKG